MPGFDSFAPPTDSVYKFMALTGIVLFLGFTALFWRLFSAFNKGFWESKRRGRVLAKKLEMLRDWYSKSDHIPLDPIKSRDETIELACLQEEHDVAVSELEEIKDSLKTVLWLFPLLLLASAALSAQGFLLWQHRVQVFEDRLLVAQVREKEGEDQARQSQESTAKPEDQPPRTPAPAPK
jgi:hypothetical protein